MNAAKVQQCVDAVCANGCDAVRAAIGALEADLPATGVEGLSREERSAVLAELKAIMAVYDDR